MVLFLLIYFMLSVGVSAAAPLSEAQMIERARCDVLVKFHSTDMRMDGANVLPETLQERCLFAGAALPGKALSAELERTARFRFTDEQSAKEAIQVLQSSDEVVWVEPRFIRHTCGLRFSYGKELGHHLDGPPNDPFYPLQWGLKRVQAEAGWDLTQGDSSVVIAICDLGINFSHSDLTSQQWVNATELNGVSGVDDDGNGVIDDFYGYDWVDLDNDPSPEDNDSHGMHVGGIAAAARNNGLGISGIAGDCRLMSVRCGTGDIVLYGYEAVWYAARTGAKIINCSWSGYGFSNYENDITQYVQSLGCVIVAAAGNEGETIYHYPAAYDGVISVAATDNGDIAASFTNRGPWVDIAAPGVAIFSTLPQNSYGYSDGTSMACPLVAGALALVQSRWPELTTPQAAARLVASSDPIDSRNSTWAGNLGLGRLNLYRALADTLSGIRIASIEWEETYGDMDGRLEPDESASLTVPVWNDLSLARSVTGFLQVVTSHARVLGNMSHYGSLPSGGLYENIAPMFELELLSSAPNGLVTPLILEWMDEDGHLLARTTYRLQADSLTTTLSNGNLALGVGESGCFGFYDYIQNQQVGVGLQEMGRPSNLLWHGSLLVGAHGDVSDNCFGNLAANRFDFQALPDSFAYVQPSLRADLEARASFRDNRSSILLFIDVEAVVLAFHSAEAENLFILEFTLTNMSVNDLEDTYVGLYLDWDIPSFDTNTGDFDSEGDLAYVRGTLPGFMWGGIASITNSFSAFRLLYNETDIYSPQWTDTRKWNILTGGITSVQSDTLADVSEIVAVGPLFIEAGGSATVAMAMLIGSDLAELRTLAATARSLYSPVPLPPHSEAKDIAIKPLTLFPNPAPVGTPLRLMLPSGETAEVRFYNLLGRQVGQPVFLDASASGHVTFQPPLPNVSGPLFYQIKTPTRKQSGRLLILK